jgi:transposase
MGKNISVSTTENVNEVGLNQKTKYDADFKAQVIEVWRSGAYQTIVECAKSYSIPENTLYTWLHQANKDPIVVNANVEIASLKKQLSKIKMELDILKKAAVYFANHAR